MNAVVRINGRNVGEGAPCFIIAEAGSNHNGRLDQAKELIDLAAQAGADAVKFQLFRASRLYPQRAGVSRYLNIPRRIYDLIEEMEMPDEWLPQLAAHCAAREVLFLASVFDEASADRLDPFVQAFKIASYEMTHLPLVEHVAAKGKPIIMSTGAATLDEVAESVQKVADTGNPNLVLMHCTAAYPAPLDALNVRAIPTMHAAFGVPVGLSDHSREPLVAPLLAIGVGAAVLEKHFTLSNDLPGPDHRFALEPRELDLMVRTVREAERAMGTGEKVVQPVETELRAFARRSIFAIRDIVEGEIFTRENIAVLRCGELAAGLPPKTYEGLLGRRARRAIPAETAIRSDDWC